jgi:UDP-N-acetylglucosamine 4,6-dehydratase
MAEKYWREYDWNDKTVLITGGTGSLGRALVDRFLDMPLRKIIIYSRDEFKQYNMDRQYRKNRDRLRYFIGDVRDRKRLYRAFAEVDVVIHAAALKHVHLMEYNPNEAVNTNITGATNIIDAAIDCGVDKVVALSTDKAVNPINIYGATKLVSDKLFRNAHNYGGGNSPDFTVVRYGNVMGSRGSVVPFFRKLRDQGQQTLPITDLRMTRFWITLDKAVDLVLRSLNEGVGGEVYISRIPSCRIVDLAEAIHPGARHEEIGVRPGEKLHEDLLTEDEARSTYDFGDHLVVYPLGLVGTKDKRLKPGGSLVKKDFLYRSDVNPEMLSVEQLRELLEKLPE